MRAETHTNLPSKFMADHEWKGEYKTCMACQSLTIINDNIKQNRERPSQLAELGGTSQLTRCNIYRSRKAAADALSLGSKTRRELSITLCCPFRKKNSLLPPPLVGDASQH